MPLGERRTRLRFEDFLLDRTADGRCLVRVRTEWTRDRHYTGEAEGTQTLQGEIRASATAALLAAESAAHGQVSFQMMGAKAFRAFDAWVVVVSVLAESKGEEDQRLMGSCACAFEEAPRGAVMAALDATNRVMERYLEE